MSTVVNIILVMDDPDDPIAEIRVTDAPVLPCVGDLVQFDPDNAGVTGEFFGRVKSRVFHYLPFHTEVDILAEPLN